MRIQPSAAAIHPESPAKSTPPPPARSFSELVARPATPANRALALKTAVAKGTAIGNSVGSTSSATAADATADTGGVESSIGQSEDENMQFLQLQSQMNAQSETFTTLSNVMKTENDTIKNTANNMQI